MNSQWEHRIHEAWSSVLEQAAQFITGDQGLPLPKLGPIHVHRDREDGVLSLTLDSIRLHIPAVRLKGITVHPEGNHTDSAFTAYLDVNGGGLSMDFTITRDAKSVHTVGVAESMIRLFGVDAHLTMETVQSDARGNLDLAREYKSKLQSGSEQGKMLTHWFDSDNDTINEILQSKKSVFAMQWPRKTTQIDPGDPSKGTINTKDCMQATSVAARHLADAGKKIGDNAFQRHSYYMEGLLYADALRGKATYQGPAPNPYDQLIAHIRGFASTTQNYREPMTVQSVMSAVEEDRGVTSSVHDGSGEHATLLELSQAPGLPDYIRDAYAEAHADAEQFYATLRDTEGDRHWLQQEPLLAVVTREKTFWSLDSITFELECAYSQTRDDFKLLKVTPNLSPLHSEWKVSENTTVHKVTERIGQMSFVGELMRERIRAALANVQLYDLLESLLNKQWRRSGNSE
ncbi:hypothetical protein [Paenibacillus massiliensis]|uniref:hypothetical protein n=1 Tax=Paenibacillus massiliensis TaxID=225917 RepID=UPI00047097BF|nr:hypothetical protein [Paenibacillus massiliensis]